MIELRLTQRGYMRGEFSDRYGARCSIQESSLATEDCIWLGCDSNDGSAMLGSRMHLTQEMAAQLIPLLQYFVEHGGLPSDTE